jgi:hypothetical protein
MMRLQRVEMVVEFSRFCLGLRRLGIEGRRRELRNKIDKGKHMVVNYSERCAIDVKTVLIMMAWEDV